MKYALFICGLCAPGCAPDLSNGTTCNVDVRVEVDVHAGAVQSDGSVNVYGGIRFEPLVGSDDKSVVFERSVHAVFVADVEAQPGTNDFNFRTWAVSIPGDRLSAYAVTLADGSKQATLPVRTFLEGNCAFDVPMADEPTVKIPNAGSGAGSGSGSGSGSN